VTVSLLTRALRTRWLILAPVVLVPLYLDLRFFGALDRERLTRSGLVRSLDKESSMGSRLLDEDRVLAALGPEMPAFGTGANYWHHADVVAGLKARYADGLWVKLVFTGGVVGLALHYLALHLLPAGLALAHPPRRPDRREAASAAWGLALLLVLLMVDSLQNSVTMPPLTLAAGALTGQAVSRRALARYRVPGASRGR
jgi:hypothetical protein